MITQSTNAGTRERFVEIPAGRRKVRGTLRIPREPQGVVAFAHGSGSGRFSPRNQFVAQKLQDAGLTTLLIDLLEEDETQDRRNVFDIELLADRLGAATHWLVLDPETRDLRLGYFGASTGAAAALVAAARRPESVAAVVSRGGRPDLAWDDLPDVDRPHTADRRGTRRGGLGAEPTGPGPARLPEGVGHHPRRDSPVRGAGSVGGSRPPRPGVVPAASGYRFPGVP